MVKTPSQVEEDHYNQGQLVDERFSVFNRKQMRKLKRQKGNKKNPEQFNQPQQRVQTKSKQQSDLRGKPQKKQQREQTEEQPIKVKKKIQKADPNKQKLLQQLEEDEREIEKLTKKLGLKKKRPNQKMLNLDGVDEELYDFLDHIEVVTKKDKLADQYKAFDELRPKKDSDDEENEDQDQDDQQMEEEEIESEAEDGDYEPPQLDSDEQADLESVGAEEEDLLEEENNENDVIEEESQQQEEKAAKIVKHTKLERTQPTKAQLQIQEDPEIEKQLKRNLNKIAEPNLDSIVGEILKIFEANPKQQSAFIHSKLFASSTLDPINILQSQISCNTVVTSVIHQIYDNTCFAEYVKSVILQLRAIEKDNELNFQIKNIGLVICHWFIFESIGIDFVKEYIFYLLEHLNNQAVESLITLVQYCGKKIRADSPATLKIILDQVIKSVEQYKNPEDESKVKFLLMTLNDLRLNKKLNNDPSERLSFFTTWLKKQIITKNNLNAKIFPQGFTICYESNFESTQWWRPLAQQQKDKLFFDQMLQSKTNITNKKNQELERLAVEQKMMTETRKAIFKVIMGADDLYEAAQNLLRLQIIKKHKFEVAVVAIELCGNEKLYNPYYANLCVQLFSLERGMRLQYQYAMWDKFKLLQTYSLRKVSNLAKFLSFLFQKQVQSIVILKWFNWEDLNDNQTLFLQLLLWNFLSKADTGAINNQKPKEDDESTLLKEGIVKFTKTKFKEYVLNQNLDIEQEEHLIKQTKLFIRVVQQ